MNDDGRPRVFVRTPDDKSVLEPRDSSDEKRAARIEVDSTDLVYGSNTSGGRKMQLRAFFLLRHQAGSWNTWVCQDLDAILTAWESRPSTATTTGILHFGFRCPATEDLEAIASRFLGDLLLTDSAKHGLPEGLTSTTGVVGSVQNLSLHRIAGGWHAPSFTPDTDRPSSADVKTRPPVAFDDQWLVDITQTHPTLRQALQNFAIHDDRSYFSREFSLDHNTRKILGLFRAKALGSSVAPDPCKLAKAAPPWLMELPLNDLDLSVRAANVFLHMNLNTVQELAALTKDELMNRRNFGHTTCKVITGALMKAIENGPPQKSREHSRISEHDDRDTGRHTTSFRTSSTLVSEIWQTFQLLPIRDAEILARRVGFMAQVQTLAQIGHAFELSRERVRQICVKAMNEITQQSSWYEQLGTRISKLQDQTIQPLSLDLMESIDPWFEGCAEHSALLSEFLKQAKNISIRIIQINGTTYFAKISQSDWDNVVRNAHKMMHSLVAKKSVTKEDCQSRIAAILPSTGREFTHLLWANISDYCHFSKGSDKHMNHQILHGFGDNVEVYVRKILELSEQPIHVREITNKVTELSGREANLSTVHNIAYQCGLLFGSGTYGTGRHFPFTQEEVGLICELTDNIVTNALPKRRWHTAEILDELLECDDLGDLQLNKYLLNIALNSCSSLAHIKRMFWAVIDSEEKDSEGVSYENRIIAILRESGCPLSTIDIKARLRETAGVNEFFQIVPTRELIRVGYSTWGLNDRDVPVPFSDQQDLMNQLAFALEERQSALHISEVTSVITSRAFPAEGLFSLAALDDRFNTSTGRYVYLKEWGNPRRETVRTAVTAEFRGVDQMTIRELLVAVEKRLGRSIRLESLHSALHALDARYQRSTGTWSFPKDDDDCEF